MLLLFSLVVQNVLCWIGFIDMAFKWMVLLQLHYISLLHLPLFMWFQTSMAGPR